MTTFLAVAYFVTGFVFGVWIRPMYGDIREWWGHLPIMILIGTPVLVALLLIRAYQEVEIRIRRWQR